MMDYIERLSWDSDFFHLRIGKAEIKSERDILRLQQQLSSARADFDLIYLFADPAIKFSFSGASLVDEKVTYHKIIESKQIDSGVMRYVRQQTNEKLFDLAVQSGVYSRFNRDSRFPAGSFERMYRRWIDNYVTSFSDKYVFVYCPLGQIQGMVTFEYSGRIAKIGLVAVDQSCRKMGIGYKLLAAVENFLYLHGVFELEVVTQGDNLPACALYSHYGFQRKEIKNIYHLWLNV